MGMVWPCWCSTSTISRPNDSLGHAVGDFLLREIGQRISHFAGPHAVVGRLSGDEFLLLQPGIKTTADAAHLARAMMDAVAQPITLDELPVSVSLSVGVAMFPSDGDRFDVLFGRADAAVYAAKRAGRAGYQFANASMNQAALERLQLEAALRAAIEGQALRLHYQPLIDLATGRLVGVEALCRWDDADRDRSRQASSSRWPRIRLIEALGGWVLREATRQLQAWHEAGHTDLLMAVNLSARQFRHGVVLAQVEDALVASGLNPARLELELTESVLLNDGEAVMNTLRQLKALGVKLSIDDFGTGYSSFAYLRRFKFDKIKIDQSFVRDLIDDPEDAAIVRGIISLALSLGLSVLAEGWRPRPSPSGSRTSSAPMARAITSRSRCGRRPWRPGFSARRGLSRPLPCRCDLRVGHHQLAHHGARAHAGVGRLELGHGHGAVDHGLDLALGVPLGQLGHHGGIGLGFALGEVAPEHAHQRGALEQGQVQRQAGWGPRQSPPPDSAPAPGDGAEGGLGKIAAHRVVDHVRALAVGQGLDASRRIGCRL
jgi:diguanylate cyclase (GGDEF)-like protein